jgi:hypothetical protein
MVNIVAYRLVAKLWLVEQRPFLGNGSVNTFPLLGRKFLIMQQLEYNNGNEYFYVVRAKMLCKRDKVSWQLSFV